MKYIEVGDEYMNDEDTKYTTEHLLRKIKEAEHYYKDAMRAKDKHMRSNHLRLCKIALIEASEDAENLATEKKNE
jgi:hypothetical protein